MSVQEMIRTHPRPAGAGGELVRCIEACYDCLATCTACADACLGEPDVQELVRCIRTNLDCADVCDVTGRVLSRQTQPEATILRALLEACAAACRACGEECERHAGHHEHCRVCAEACRRCEQSCDALLRSIR
jgi:uncharacterized membrane protein